MGSKFKQEKIKDMGEFTIIVLYTGIGGRVEFNE